MSTRPVALLAAAAVLVSGACTNDYAALDVSGIDASATNRQEEDGSTGSPGAGGRSQGGGSGETGGASEDGGSSSDGGAAPGNGGASPGTGGTSPGTGGASQSDGGAASGGDPGAGGAAADGGAGSGGEPPDAAPEASTPLTCDQRYGGASEYLLCDEDTGNGTCRISVRTNARSCADVCTEFGGSCLAAVDNVDDTRRCTPRPMQDTCDAVRAITICTCSRN